MKEYKLRIRKADGSLTICPNFMGTFVHSVYSDLASAEARAEDVMNCWEKREKQNDARRPEIVIVSREVSEWEEVKV